MMNNSTTAFPELTIDKLSEIAAVLERLSQPEPVGEWMRDRGFPPETSFLVLPEARRATGPQHLPYVRYSPFVEGPCLIRDPLAYLGLAR